MKDKINPDEFVISRKRKKYRFAKFHNAENCFETDEWKKREIDVVEVGAGTGFFVVELAQMYPDKSFAAIDVKADRLQRGAYKSLELGLKNIVFIRARADQITELFDESSLEQLWLTFPDPYPKKGSAGRRMTHPNHLSVYQRLLCQSGSFYLKHDSPEFFQWSLEQLVVSGWKIDELTFDLHQSQMKTEYKLQTSYEERWISEGRIIQFARASK